MFNLRVNGITEFNRYLSIVQRNYPKAVKRGGKNWGKKVVRMLQADVRRKHHWRGKLESSMEYKITRNGGNIKMFKYGLELAGRIPAQRTIQIKRGRKIFDWTKKRFLGNYRNKGQGSRVRWTKKGNPIGTINFVPDDFIGRVMRGQRIKLVKSINRAVDREIRKK